MEYQNEINTGIENQELAKEMILGGVAVDASIVETDSEEVELCTCETCEQADVKERNLEACDDDNTQKQIKICGRDVTKKIGVYAKVNDDGFITEVNSDIYIDDLSGWTKIDEGVGDKYSHAQSLYYETPLMDNDGNYLIKL